MNRIFALFGFFALLLPTSSCFAQAQNIDREIRREQKIQQMFAAFQGLSPLRHQTQLMDAEELSLGLDAAESIIAEGDGDSSPYLGTFLQTLPKEKLSAGDLVRLFRLAGQNDPQAETQLIARLANRLHEVKDDTRFLYELMLSEKNFGSEAGRALVLQAKRLNPEDTALFARAEADNKRFVAPSLQEIQDLFYLSPEGISSYRGGAYKNKPRLFLFCRHNRNYACLFVLKDSYDQPVRLPNQQLWSQPALALSRHGYGYNKSNGATPAGLHLIDGVMPTANIQWSFGQNRRMILNFVPKSKREELYKQFLPSSSTAGPSDWWKQAVVARKIGRHSLRIHGTGEINTDPRSTYYPHVPTQGCISQREGTYETITYNDQRLLLDRMMEASGLEAGYENETAIKGLLYLVELDEIPAPVTLQDLAVRGIL